MKSSEQWVVGSLNFVVCPPFHGATFASLLLNNHSRVTSLGDTIPARKRLDSLCSCGEIVRECPFWSAILSLPRIQGYGAGEKILPAWPGLATWHPWTNRAASVGLGLAANLVGPSVWSLIRTRRDEYLSLYREFYEAGRRLGGSDLFIDGSKSMSRALVLASMMPEAEVRVLHIVRDPRDYHCSCRKNRSHTVTPRRSGREWRDRHLAIMAMVRLIPGCSYLRVRYEDLCDGPRETFRKMCSLFGVEFEDVFRPASDERKNHVIGSRTKKRFDGTIRPSRGWQEKIDPDEAAGVVRSAWPLFHRFGYR